MKTIAKALGVFLLGHIFGYARGFKKAVETQALLDAEKKNQFLR